MKERRKILKKTFAEVLGIWRRATAMPAFLALLSKVNR